MLTGSGRWELIKAPDPAKEQELKPLQSFSVSPGAPHCKNHIEKVKKKEREKNSLALSNMFKTNK